MSGLMLERRINSQTLATRRSSRALVAGAVQGVVAENVGLDTVAEHRVVNVHCKARVLARLAGADQAAVADNVGLDAWAEQRVADVDGKICALLAGNDQSTVSESCWAPWLGKPRRSDDGCPT